jgi:hypothetical protein
MNALAEAIDAWLQVSATQHQIFSPGPKTSHSPDRPPLGSAHRGGCGIVHSEMGRFADPLLIRYGRRVLARWGRRVGAYPGLLGAGCVATGWRLGGQASPRFVEGKVHRAIRVAG